MANKAIIGIIIFSLAAFYASPTFGASIKLKTGETVEGKLVEKTSSYVKMAVSGVILTYFYDDIETTSWEKSEPLESDTLAPRINSEENPPTAEYYVNKKAGVIVWHPKDWTVYDKFQNYAVFNNLTPQETKNSTFNYICAFSPGKDKNNLDPLVMIIIQNIPKSLKDASAEDLAEVLQEGLKKSQYSIKILELPNVVEIDGKKLVRQSSLRTITKLHQKIVKYSFIKGSRLFIVSCSSDPKLFNQNKKIFEKIATNLKGE